MWKGVIKITSDDDPQKIQYVSVPMSNIFYNQDEKLKPGMKIIFADCQGDMSEGVFVKKIQVGGTGKRFKVFSFFFNK